MTGDLEGCIYGHITGFRIHPSGTYQEYADETFVGSYGALSGTFELTEFFTAKFDADGNPVWGRCKHPIVAGSGTGEFEGVIGRLDFKDDVEAGNAPYKEHPRFDRYQQGFAESQCSQSHALVGGQRRPATLTRLIDTTVTNSALGERAQG